MNNIKYKTYEFLMLGIYKIKLKNVLVAYLAFKFTVYCVITAF